MAFEEEKEQGASLERIKKACKIAYRFTTVIYIIFAIYWLFLLGLEVFAIINPYFSLFVYPSSIPSIASNVIFGLIIFLIIKSGADLFKEIRDKGAPFSLLQVKRIRRISYLLILKAIYDVLVPATFSPIFAYKDIDVSYINSNQTMEVFVNPETILFAILFFCISLIFQYGVLLQHDVQEYL